MRNRAQAFRRLCQLLRFIEHRCVAEKLRQTHQAARHVRLNGQAVEVELHIQRVFVRHHVAHRRAGRRGHERNAVRTGRDGLLVPLGEQAFRLQFSLELLKRKVERTRTVRNDLGDVKLHRACARERADARLDDDLHAVLQTEFQPHRI